VANSVRGDLAGTYGVGKSTIGATLSAKASIPFFSAGSLISEVNGEEYGAKEFADIRFAQTRKVSRLCEPGLCA